MASSAKSKNDDFIMDTNNSSIVSKRSVEKLYYNDEPEYFRHFVRKFQRRSPLINRGYWLRMRAIDDVVKQFLGVESGKQKVVVNLGCGYDPLPFQFLGKHTKLCQHATFVDVDYPQLMRKKFDVICNTPALMETLPGLQRREPDQAIVGCSEKYMAVGCDLRELDKLSRILENEFNISESSIAILFVAEVSIAYMDREASQAVLRWAAMYDNVRFCLLEQHLPTGRDHPFAQTMLKHFEKLRTPLRAIGTIDDMVKRIVDAGWSASGTGIRTLWEIWNDLTKQDRQRLDAVEPFDEWEEFALFGSHYFLLVADKSKATEYSVAGVTGTLSGQNVSTAVGIPEKPTGTLRVAELPPPHSQRRFAAVLPGMTQLDAAKHVGLHGGLGSRERLSSCDVYTGSDEVCNMTGPSLPSAVMCHTITPLGIPGDCLLVGGRTSPDKGSALCWLRCNGEWAAAQNLPDGRYRHCAMPVKTLRGSDQVLVFGGKADSVRLSTGWLLWTRRYGWSHVTVPHNGPGNRFGAAMCVTRCDENSTVGSLTGGIDASGSVLQDYWEWTFRYDDGCPTISFVDGTSKMKASLGRHDCSLGRFGACLLPWNDRLVLIGGVSMQGALPRCTEILDLSNHVAMPLGVGPRPLLIGFSSVAAGDELLILGGGATCFSFGSFWNTGHILQDGSAHSSGVRLRLQRSTRNSSYVGNRVSIAASDSPNGHERKTAIPRTHLQSQADFAVTLAQSRPVLIEGSNIGPCTHLWTDTYLKKHVGADRKVVVHCSPTAKMDFHSKNFTYEIQKFGDFMDAVGRGERFYLRAISAEKRAEKPTVLAQDYPDIAGDFRLPPELQYVVEHAHSSPLRISGPVTMWLHYDVMANVLVQVRGKKRVLLYPPSDVSCLGFTPGASSSSIDVFTATHPPLAHTHPHEASLGPGDILFIPPLWLHTAEPTDGVSVAVNVFFRNLDDGYAAGRDTYGNRDLAAYEEGRKGVGRVVKSFDGLPSDMRRFYLERLGTELVDNARDENR